jgi:integrase
MAGKILTDRGITALKPAQAGKRYDRPDGIVPGLAVRVTDKGSKSFVLTTRYPGSPNPTRRALGDVGELALAAARSKARDWLAQIKAGIDPRVIEEERRRAEEEKRRAAERASITFATVVEIFLAEYVHPRCRTAKKIEAVIRSELLPDWGNRPISSISRDDIEDLIEAICKRKPKTGRANKGRYAHSVLAIIKMFFGWAADVVKRDKPYRLDASPADRIRPAKLIGEKAIRTRVLDDAELRKLWKVCDEIAYPYGKLVQTLMLCGVRLQEAAGAQWNEFNGTWVIPASRHKSETGHVLPITDDLAALLASLPRFASGDFVFSASYGKKPVSGFSKAKADIDARMGDVPPFVFHDVRRTVRSQLSALKIEDHIAEMVIGHGRKGMQRIYDQHKYQSEVRDALVAWQRKLRLIVDPADNVVALAPARG